MPRSSQLAQLLRCIRWADVLILQGAPVLGIVFSIGPMTATKPIASSIFGVGSVLLVAHVFTLNDWADFARGVHHSNRAMLQFESRNITPRLLLIFSFLLLVVSLLLFLFLSGRCLLLAVVIAVLGIFYSHPLLNAKSMPIVSTLLHLIGGLLYFLLGYALFSEIDYRGIAIGLFLGLTFAAGHPVQEVRDLDEDRRVGARTNAVVFGQLPCFFAGVILFTAQYFYLFVLAWSGLIPRFLAALPIVFYPIHIWWSVVALRSGLTSESIIRFENRYRILYAIIGLTMLLSILY
jgi:4-hydroxybenzoate polyprenyltransferase